MSKITRYKGDTYSIEAIISKDTVPLNFTLGNNTAILSFSKGTLLTSIAGVNGSANGEISFPFPADVKAGVYKYDIQVTSNTGEIRTYVKDILEINEDIT